MALINCPECRKEVSDRAAACPHCGNPMSAAPGAALPVETPVGHAVTIEATGKTWKVVEAVGAAVFLLGLVSCAYTRGLTGGSMFLIFAGSAIYIVGSVSAWWHHA